MRRPTSRRMGLALAAVGVLALTGAGTWTVATPAGLTSAQPAAETRSAASSLPPAPRQAADTSTEGVRTAAESLLSARSDALARQDAGAWEATVAAPGGDDARRQLGAYRALVALGVTRLTVGELRVVAVATGAGGGPSRGTVTARIGYQIPGFDRGPRVATRTLTLVAGAAGWRLDSDQADSDQLQLWDLPQLRVLRSGTVMVAGDAPQDSLAQRLADARAGQQQVAAALGASTPAVVVVPATEAEAARQLGHSPGSEPGQVAATTEGATGPDGTASADRVVLAPDAFERLTDQGRRLVVTHELVHVTARATTAGHAPPWLSEGLAEDIAWAAVDMPLQTAAAQLLAKVRGGGAPAALPGTAEFDPSRADLASAYQASWLAVRRIVAEHGQQAATAFFRAVAGVPGGAVLSVDQAFATVLGTTSQAFVAGWRDELERLAR